MKTLPAWLLLACTALPGLALAQALSSGQAPLAIDIPAGPLQQGLERLSRLTGLQLLYDPRIAVGCLAPEVKGTMPAAQALERLLSGTDISFQLTGADAVALIRQATPADPLPEVRVEANEPRFVAPTNRDHIGRIWAPVMINGQGPFRLVLDTGASRSALIARTALELGLAPESSLSTRLYGLTGTALVPTVHVDSMAVGDIVIDAATLPIVADVFGGADGVLGRDGLPDKRIVADFKHDRLIIARSHGQRAPPGFLVVHLKLTSLGLLALDTRIGGVPTKAIIDTGAQGTIGNLALRDALMRQPPTNQGAAEVIGVTLDMQKGDQIPAPPIRLDALVVVGLKITFGDMSLFEHWNLTREPTVLIGMDVLGVVDELVIDYKLQQLQVRMPEASAPLPMSWSMPFG